MNQTEEHYSYRVYADPDTARSFDSLRFGGAIGELLKQSQERLVFSILPKVAGWNVIDVGAGTGRFAVPLIEQGACVTACDASAQMLQVLQEKIQNERLKVSVEDAHQLPFPDRCFDCALSFRMLMHVVDWRKALGQLCRVSRDWVVIDFPPKRGFLLFAPIWHRVQSLFGVPVQAYKTLSISAVKAELEKNGFEVVRMDWGFFIPLVLHRLVSSPAFTRGAEKLFKAIGLTRLAGSPVTIFARRKR